MNLLKDMLLKVMETPEVVSQLRKSLVNRDLAIEIDGKRFQIMKRRDDDEVEKLQNELTALKSRLYDVENSLVKMLEAVKGTCANSEKTQAIEQAERLLNK